MYLIGFLVVFSLLTYFNVDQIISFLNSLAGRWIYQSVSKKEWVILYVLFQSLIEYNFLIYNSYVIKCFKFICNLTRYKIWVPIQNFRNKASKYFDGNDVNENWS
jgi:hypothetical protein